MSSSASLVACAFFSVLAETAAACRAAATATDKVFLSATEPVGVGVEYRESVIGVVISVMADWSSFNNTSKGTVPNAESRECLFGPGEVAGVDLPVVEL